MRHEEPGRECVADAKKLCYPLVLSAEIHTLRIGDLEPDPNSSDEEKDDYISLDAPLTTTVSTARSNQTKLNNVSRKEPIKQILRKRMQKEKGYATPKNVRFGAYEPVKEAPIPISPTPIDISIPEEAIPDVKVSIKKNLERKRHPRVVNVLKESVGVTTITKRILDLGINLMVRVVGLSTGSKKTAYKGHF